MIVEKKRSRAVRKQQALTLEYFYDNDYDENDGGTGESSYAYTTQLAYG